MRIISISHREEEHPGISDSSEQKEIRMDAEYDSELRSYLCRLLDRDGFMAGTRGERDSRLDHGAMIPLYFLKKQNVRCKVLRIGLSGQSLEAHYRLGQYISRAADALHRNVVMIASGDLSISFWRVVLMGTKRRGRSMMKESCR